MYDNGSYVWAMPRRIQRDDQQTDSEQTNYSNCIFTFSTRLRARARVSRSRQSLIPRKPNFRQATVQVMTGSATACQSAKARSSWGHTVTMTTATNTGSAYVYRFDGTDWNFETKLLARRRGTVLTTSAKASSSQRRHGRRGSRPMTMNNGGSYYWLARTCTALMGTAWNFETKLLARRWGTDQDYFGEKRRQSPASTVVVGAFQ